MEIYGHIDSQFKDYQIGEEELAISAYNEAEATGLEFVEISKPVSVAEVCEKDKECELDWVFNFHGLKSYKVLVGNLIAVEIKSEFVDVLKAVKDNCFLYTAAGWGWLVDRNVHTVDILGECKQVWIAEYAELSDLTVSSFLTVDGLRILSIFPDACSIRSLKARCVSTMELLDNVHRDYVNKHKFVDGDVLAVPSVAGSGKTTMLLTLSKIHKNKRVLYLAFNKNLVTEIKDKIKKGKISNMEAYTFDALCYRLYCIKVGGEPRFVELKPYNIAQYVSWFQDKPYKLKNVYCKHFSKFCTDAESTTMESWCLRFLKRKDAILEKLWTAALAFQLTTYETIRKMAFINKWFEGFIDKNYDIVMGDETQDFDMIMLKMLLNDTKCPKVFVGDPKQSIYDFRGCINAFKFMPTDATIVEFYSTFRIGEPACSQLRAKIPDLWMISKAVGGRKTDIGGYVESGEKAVWLFRTWRLLFQTARNTPGTWIYGWDAQVARMRALHAKLANSWSVIDESEFEDDLPQFLKSITKEELDLLISDVERNCVMITDARYKMYTVHSYKGMEDDVVRMASDITIEHENLYYVSITRGMKKTVVDNEEVASVGDDLSTGCTGKGECIKQCLHKPHLKADYGPTGYCPSICKFKCVPMKCMFYSTCKQRRPQHILDQSKGQCFDCRVGI